ncbi:MAG: rhodanese-related sulfurtransferase [Maribacter sp.]|jgi:rhodanese-related sulfurtransferase
MRFFIPILFLILTFIAACQAQIPANKPACQNEDFEASLSQLLSFTVPLKSVEDLSNEKLDDYLILDTREKEEYNTSHISNAKYVGYNNFDIKTLNGVDKEQPIIVYCSVGYRSEKIGEKLQKEGFTEVYNLYGSIFEWANQGMALEDSEKQSTTKIHTYNKKWSKWVFNKKYQKIW